MSSPPLWMSIEPRSTDMRLLLSVPQHGTTLKARLPLHPGHPRAVAMLLEALSAWYRRPLYVALDAAAPAVSEFPDHWSLWLGDLSSLEIHVEWIGPVPGHRERRDPFLETMGDFKEARRLVTYAATGQR